MAVLWDGQSGCGVSDQAFVFETYSKNCSGLQSVVDWPQCWGEGSCVVMAFRPFHTDVGSLLESCFFSFPA